MTLHRLALIICVLLLSLPAPAQTTDTLTRYGIGPELVITSGPLCQIDTGATPSLALAGTRPFTLAYSSWETQLARDPRPYTFWLQYTLQNTTDSTLHFFVDGGLVDYIDSWLISLPDSSTPGSLALPQHQTGGSLRSPKPGTSLVNRTYGVLPFTLVPHQAARLLLAIRQLTVTYSWYGLGLYSQAALDSQFARDYEEGHSDNIFQWLFQGFLLCQFLYMLFQWMTVRRREYLYYLGYLLAVGLYFLSKFESDLGLNLLFTHFPVLKVYLNKTLLILPYFLYFRFVRLFLELPTGYPRINAWIVRLEYFLLLYLAADLAFILLTFDQRTQTIVFTFVLLFVFLVSASFIIYLFRHRQNLIYYVLIGSLFVAVGNILGQVFTWLVNYSNLSLGISNILLYPQIGVLLEVLCFTAGLGYKSHLAEQEKIGSQEKLIEQLKANELLQSRMQHIRNKIAQDLHDDIGSTLSSISILSDLALRQKNDPHTLETMSEIKDSSILLMERMDDIVWSINPKNDSFENLLVRIRHFATTLFEARGIDYVIDIQKNIHEVRLPMDYRQHIYLILKEAINNLVKYAQSSQATIRVGFDRHRLELSVRDNGAGFDLSAGSDGNGLPGMQRRADLMQAQLSIQSAPGKGTTITLQVATA